MEYKSGPHCSDLQSLLFDRIQMSRLHNNKSRSGRFLLYLLTTTNVRVRGTRKIGSVFVFKFQKCPDAIDQSIVAQVPQAHTLLLGNFTITVISRHLHTGRVYSTSSVRFGGLDTFFANKLLFNFFTALIILLLFVLEVPTRFGRASAQNKIPHTRATQCERRRPRPAATVIRIAQDRIL